MTICGEFHQTGHEDNCRNAFSYTPRSVQIFELYFQTTQSAREKLPVVFLSLPDQHTVFERMYKL